MKSMRRFVFAALLGGVMLPTTAFAQQSPNPPEATAQPQPAPASAQATPAAPAAPAAAGGAAPTSAPPSAVNPPRTSSRWANSQLQATVTSNWSTFDPNYQLSGGATSVVDMNISLRPRYRLNRHLQLRGRWDYYYEFTNSNSTTTQHEPRFGDPSLDLWINSIPSVGDLSFKVAVGLLFPVSPESRATTLIVTPRVIGQAAWGVDAFGGEFGLIGQVSYSRPISQYTTPSVRNAPNYPRQCAGDGDLLACNLQLSGRTNVRDQLSWTAIVVQTWGLWSPGVAFGMTHQWAYGLPSTSVSGGLSATDVGANDAHLRQLVSFSGWLDFSPNPWLTVEAGYYIFRNVLDADGTYGNPFYGQYQDWRMYLNANIVIDKFIDALRGTTDAGGGVIRTQNTPRQPLGFRM